MKKYFKLASENLGERELDRIGNVFGIVRPSEISFIVDKRANLEIGEYVTIDYPGIEDEVLALVHSIVLSNENIPENLIRDPQSFDSLQRLGNLEEGEKQVACAEVLGYYTKVGFIRPRFPPKPSACVKRAGEELLNHIFLNEKTGANIGHLVSNKKINVYLSIDEIVRRHLAILAMTGAGKSNTVAILIKEILKKNGSIVIVDPHNEYGLLREDMGDEIVIFNPSRRTRELGTHPIYFKLANLLTEELAALLNIGRKAVVMRSLIYDAIKSLRKETREWDFEQLKQRIDELGEDTDKYRKGTPARIKRHIERIEDLEVFKKSLETPVFDFSGASLVKPGQASVISISGLPSYVQDVVVSRLATKIFRARVNAKLDRSGEKCPCPTFMIVEEVHNFASAHQTSLSLNVLKKTASEGRKFGVGLCLVSQRPGKVHSDVLSQCNTMIILRTINPTDQIQIRQSSEAISDELLADLPGLNKGEAIIVGSGIPIPVITKIWKYDGLLGGDDIPIVEEWNKFSEKMKENSLPTTEYEGDFSDPFR